MRNIGLSSLDLDLIDLTAAHQGQQPSTCDVRVAPVRNAQLRVVLGLQVEGMAGPGKQCLALADDPVLAAIEVDRDYAGYGRLGGDEGGDGAGGGDFLVEKGNADGGAAEGLEEGEGGQGVFWLAAQGNEGATAGVEGLGGGEGDGEQGEGRAEDLEAGVWRR